MTELGSLLPPAQLYIALAGVFTLLSILLTKDLTPVRFLGVNWFKALTYLVLFTAWAHVIWLVAQGSLSVIGEPEKHLSTNLIAHGITLFFLAFLAFMFLFRYEEQTTIDAETEEAGSLNLK